MIYKSNNFQKFFQYQHEIHCSMHWRLLITKLTLKLVDVQTGCVIFIASSIIHTINIYCPTVSMGRVSLFSGIQ